VIKAKYPTEFLFKLPKGCSSSWRALWNQAPLIWNHLRCKIGDGKSTKFWYDLCLYDLPLNSMPMEINSDLIDDSYVHDHLIENGNWNTKNWRQLFRISLYTVLKNVARAGETTNEEPKQQREMHLRSTQKTRTIK